MLDDFADDPDMENSIVDSMIVRARACAAGNTKNGEPGEQALGRSYGGFSTKIHVTVDGLGNPLRLHLTAGQLHNLIKASDMMTDRDFEYIFADKSYGAKDFLDEIVVSVLKPLFHPKRKLKCRTRMKTWRYREWHLLECFIGKIKHFRHVFSRFDKLARRYLGFLHLTSVLIWLR